MFDIPDLRSQRQRQEYETELERLTRELREAHELIERLKDALGSNHPLGRQRGLF